MWETGLDGDALKNINKAGPFGREGYVNIADQLGLSGRRDNSTYHSHWVRRELRAGRIDDRYAEGQYDHGYDSHDHDYPE